MVEYRTGPLDVYESGGGLMQMFTDNVDENFEKGVGAVRKVIF